MLEENPELKAQFNAKKIKDEKFATDWFEQLNWLHENSVHYKKAYLQYPVYLIN